MRGFIDRFEGDYAVIETDDMQMVNIPRKNVSPDARAGDYVVEINGVFKTDRTLTEKRKEKISKLINQAFK